MSIRANFYFAGLAVVLLSLPAWAHSQTTELDTDHPYTISGTQLPPGEYDFKVEDKATQLTVVKYGKVVAQVPCHWIQLPGKPDSTVVQTSGNQITEIDFKGQTDAVQIP